MKTMRQVALFGFMLALLEPFWQMPAYAVLVPPSEILKAEFTSGEVDFRGRFGHKLDKLLDKPGLLVMGEYQPGPDIIAPITQGRRTYSLFTSGIQGAPPPTATIDGSSITVDLSSLFFGVSRGEHFLARNIGGMATGLFNPETLEFCLTWDHLFRDRPQLGIATFSLHGQLAIAQVPIPASAWMFLGGGIALLLGGRMYVRVRRT
jgi:hypothetical protein